MCQFGIKSLYNHGDLGNSTPNFGALRARAAVALTQTAQSVLYFNFRQKGAALAMIDCLGDTHDSWGSRGCLHPLGMIPATSLWCRGRAEPLEKLIPNFQLMRRAALIAGASLSQFTVELPALCVQMGSKNRIMDLMGRNNSSSASLWERSCAPADSEW